MFVSARPLWLACLAAATLVAASCTNDIGVSCPPGQLVCNDACVSIVEDSKNCGGCGIACPGEIVCIGGQCTCPKNQTNCSDVCVRLDRDPKNCNGCGIACNGGQVCSGGQCLGECPNGQTNCTGSCVDTMSDDENCGGCAMPCTAGKSCVGGTCQLLCNNNLTVCATGCVDTQHDPANCGGCDMPCAPNQFCVGGMCQDGCPQTNTLCPNPLDPSGAKLCVDTQSDPFNCGGCGTDDVVPPSEDMGPKIPHVCFASPGANTVGVCVKGKCNWACEDGFGACGVPVGGGETPPPPVLPGEPLCTDLTQDSCDCGACGITCSGWGSEGGSCLFFNEGGSTCCGAMCRPIETLLSDTSCGDCAATTACGVNATCCIKPAPPGTRTVGGECADTRTDVNHCGNCATNCNFFGFTAPVCCDFGDGSACRDLAAATSCGDCATDCTISLGSSVGAQCCPGAAAGAFACADTSNDLANCGGCGIDCNTTTDCTGMGTVQCVSGSCGCTGL